MRNPRLTPSLVGNLDPQRVSTFELLRFLVRLIAPLWHLLLLLAYPRRFCLVAEGGQHPSQ